MVEPKWIIFRPTDIREVDVRELREREGGCVLVSQNTYQFWREMRVANDADQLLPEIERTMNSIWSVQTPATTKLRSGYLTLYR
jgi:hypothetical protein